MMTSAVGLLEAVRLRKGLAPSLYLSSLQLPAP
jgi:hypothetical protein